MNHPYLKNELTGFPPFLLVLTMNSPGEHAQKRFT